MAERDIGDIGENFAEALATNAGVVVNKSQRDKHGWDQLWELQRADEVFPSKLPLDLRPGRATCKVQVESGIGLTKNPPQEKGRAGVWKDIKLSTWLELCAFPGPAFFLVLDYDDNRSHVPSRAFLVHIDESWITKTLKTARVRKKPPNKTRQGLDFMEAEEILPLDSSSLVHALELAIGPDPMAYSVRKHELWSSVGYDKERNSRLIVHSSIIPDSANTLDELTNLALGLTELRFSSFERYDNRFFSPELIETREGGTLRFRPPNLGPATVKIQHPLSGDSLILSGELFASTSLAPWLPPQDVRCRLVTHSFDLVFAPMGGTSTARILNPRSESARVPLLQLAEHGKLIELILDSTHKALSVEISLPDSGSPWIGQLAGEMGDNENDARILAQAFQSAAAIAKRLSISLDLDVNPIHLFENNQGLLLLSAMLSGDTSGCQIGFAGHEPVPSHIGIVIAHGLELRDDCFVFVVGIMHGRPLQQGSMYILKPVSLQLMASGYRSVLDEAKACSNEGIRRAEEWFKNNDVVRMNPPSASGGQELLALGRSPCDDHDDR